MEQLAPWEEAPDENYWQMLLGTSQTSGNTSSATQTDGWARAQASYTQGEVLELRVVGYNRGGVLVDLGNVRGFVPASQLASLPRQLSEEERAQALANYVGTMLRVQTIELDRARNRLILSERVANSPSARAEQLLATFEPGQTRRGIVRNVTDFGAFVDLGGVEGLIHVSELSWHYVPHPRQALQPGQEVEVYVLEVNREQKRIACSLKRLTPNPWLTIGDKLKPGDWTEGVVTSIVPFGAFVRVNEGVEGLVHISELSRGNHASAHQDLQVGQTVRVRVLELDATQQRMKLGLRRPRSHNNNRPPAPPPEPDPGYWDYLAKLG
ncbi:MAG: S1 RNA-binding domain-containing protein [Anaerolineae bacterium]|nr:S1 RNA-binding domain-containing protein [Anaerolineae bacterium]